MNTGIYKITCGGTFYYGQAQDLKKREGKHMSYIQRGEHHNRHLQRAYDKYGEFTFEVVLYCETNELDRYEQWFLDTYQPMEKCANIAKDAAAPTRGLKLPHSDEAKAKMSASHKGKKLSDEHRAKIAAAHKGRKIGPMSAEHKARLGASVSRAKRKYTYQVTFTDGKQREYPTLDSVAKAVGVTRESVSKWALGVRPPSKKYGITALTRKAL